MKASKQSVQKATEAFIKELEDAFPQVRVEIVPERFETADVWLEVIVPNARVYDKVSRKLGEMNVRYLLETGVYVFATIQQQRLSPRKRATTAAPVT